MARIIIIEDEISIRNVLKSILIEENKNYIIDEASMEKKVLRKFHQITMIWLYVI